jgi:hypothetical protein
MKSTGSAFAFSQVHDPGRTEAPDQELCHRDHQAREIPPERLRLCPYRATTDEKRNVGRRELSVFVSGEVGG